jgi:hypothetical protein
MEIRSPLRSRIVSRARIHKSNEKQSLGAPSLRNIARDERAFVPGAAIWKNWDCLVLI